MLTDLANTVVKELKRRRISVMMQTSSTSNTVYLLLEYGMLGTLRISDHMPKYPVAHRFNLITTCVEPLTVTGEQLEHTDRVLVSKYYPTTHIKQLADEIEKRKQATLSILSDVTYHQMKIGILEREYSRQLNKQPYFYIV